MRQSLIIELPPERWREAKLLRLEALMRAPEAFASSYEDEAAFGDEVWLGRLRSAYKRDGAMTFFAEVDGALCGMAGATWPTKAKLRHVAEVYGVYVSPGRRGKGIASELLKRLLAELESLGQIEKVKLTVNSESEAALRLYAKLGFEIVGVARGELKVGGRDYDLRYMERV